MVQLDGIKTSKTDLRKLAQIFLRRSATLRLIRDGIVKVAELSLYGISFCMPRTRMKWVFGSYCGAFVDNSKYLFLHVVQRHPEVKATWVCWKKEQLDYFSERNLPAVYKRSWTGLYECLTAHMHIYSFYPTDVNFAASGGAILCNLWHGIGLKKIEFNDTQSPESHLRVATLANYVRAPWQFRRPDIVLSTSRFVTDYFFTSSFRVGKEACLEFGYPRCDVLLWSAEERQVYFERYATEAERHTHRRITQAERAYIYLPTFRDDGIGVLAAAGFDLPRLNQLLQRTNAVFVIKLHMNEPKPFGDDPALDRIIFLSSTTDVYPLLPATTALITDYSSIYYDYIMMSDKRVILFPFDLNGYVEKCRGLHFPYAEAMKGEVVNSFEEMLRALAEPRRSSGLEMAYRSLYWGDYSGQASEKVASHLVGREHEIV